MNIKVIGREAVQDGLSYLAQNPFFLVRAALSAARLRLGVPLDALRWLVARLAVGPKVPKDIELAAASPALSVGASVNLMGTPLRISANLHFEGARVEGEEQVLVSVRVRDLAIVAPKDSPASQMIGALDLRKPGNLIMFMPKRPPALVEAKDDLFVVDLMKIGKLAQNAALRKGLLVVSEVLSIRSLNVEGDLLVLALRAQPLGLPMAIARLRT